jgi:hypothetical protein
MFPRPLSMFSRQRAASEAALVVLTASAEVIVTGRLIDAPEPSMTATKASPAPAKSQCSRTSAAPSRVSASCSGPQRATISACNSGWAAISLLSAQIRSMIRFRYRTDRPSALAAAHCAHAVSQSFNKLVKPSQPPSRHVPTSGFPPLARGPALWRPSQTAADRAVSGTDLGWPARNWASAAARSGNLLDEVDRAWAESYFVFGPAISSGRCDDQSAAGARPIRPVAAI